MNLSVKYNDDLRAAIQEVESFGTPFCNLNTAIASVAGLLVPYPDTARIEMFGAFTPQGLGPDVTQGTAQLFHQITSNLKLLLHIGLCRTAAMLEDIIDGLNTSRYLQVCLTCRALMEHLAIAQARYRRMCPLLIELENVKPSDVRRVLSRKQSSNGLFASTIPVIEELDRWYSAGRFNFGTLKGNPDFPTEVAKQSEKRQIGIGDAIDALDWSGALLPCRASCQAGQNA
jgi:hypothetical protein